MVHSKRNRCEISTTLLNITWSGISGPACCDPLKQDYMSRVLLSRTESMSKTVEHVWLVGPDVYLAFPICIQTISCTVPWLSALSVPWFISLPSHLPSCLFHVPPIKNAPRWLVKGKWEWRLGFFKDPSQLFKAKFDSENGGGLISHSAVFNGMNFKMFVRY